jgi:autotransporter passenger strand-loop-strand repeat protein
VSSGGEQEVAAGGGATGITVSSGGIALVDSGGTAATITVQSGGEIILAAGAAVSGLTVSAGGVEIFEPAGALVPAASLPGTQATRTRRPGAAGGRAPNPAPIPVHLAPVPVHPAPAPVHVVAAPPAAATPPAWLDRGLRAEFMADTWHIGGLWSYPMSAMPTPADTAAAKLVEAMASFDAAPMRRSGALFNLPDGAHALDGGAALGPEHRGHVGNPRA